jgi:hypothetical protein
VQCSAVQPTILLLILLMSVGYQMHDSSGKRLINSKGLTVLYNNNINIQIETRNIISMIDLCLGYIL